MSMFQMGLIGYGAVGRMFAAGLKEAVQGVSAWDVKFNDEAARADASGHARQHGVQVCDDLAGLCEAAALIEAAGARYVEAAVMTSVPPYGVHVHVPMLLGGPHAEPCRPALQALGLDVRLAGPQLGVASATKMCRSVMIKALEAQVIERFTAARHYGVADAVVASLQETFPGIDWTQQGRYFFSRVAQHGQRRAEEMREAAQTVQEAGFEPGMAAAIARKHDWMAARAQAGCFHALGPEPSWQAYADRLMAARGLAANDD